MLHACTTVGPDFEEPEVAWLNDWQPDLYGQIENAEQQTEVDLRFWWRLFNDPVLNGLIETARRENPSLRIAGLRILESRAVLGIADSNLYPQLHQLGGAVTYVSEQQYGRQASGTSASPAISPPSTSAGHWISGDDSGVASNRPMPRFSRPSPVSRTCRYC